MAIKSDFPIGRRNSVVFNMRETAESPSFSSKKESSQGRNLGSGRTRQDILPESISNISKKSHKLKPSRFLSGADGSISPNALKIPTNVSYENTYKTVPDRNAAFDDVKVTAIIRDVLEENLRGSVYNKELCPNLCLQLAELIKEGIKLSGIPRYKLISNVVIFEDRRQGFCYGSRCLWNEHFDNFATASFHGSNFIVVGTCFATYLD